MKILRFVLILVLLAAGFVAGFGYGRWYAKPAPAASRRILYYVDPMHPSYRSDKPGIAPDCGMKLEPVYADQQTGSVPQASPAGTFPVSVEKQQLIGVEFAQAEYTSGSDTLRAVGKVAFDETRITRVHSRVDGWVDQVFADFTGKLVRKGQPLLTLYSPELLAAQQEYLLALKARDVLRHSTMEMSHENAETLIDAAHKRLELWDLSETQIEQVRRTGKAVRNITIESPASGYLTTRNAFPRQRIMPDTELYQIVDLSHVWIMADVFESDAARVRLGQYATVSLSYLPGRSFGARVSYILPQVDPATRTLKVRLEADNPGLLLKPEMYVDVEFRLSLGRRLTVPSEAVVDSGERQTVFVDRGNGHFEPRAVSTGQTIGNRIEILRGLQAGERVVSSGNFLIDSESQLKAAATGGAHPHD
jgi:membrane fusion protein, copper/silver efflux system